MPKELNVWRTPLAASIASVLYPVTYANAQDAEADEANVLEEVIVTATLREVGIQDVPQSIQAFTTVDIERAE
jgi:outer membrane receptor protein involved in Fe transport